MSYRNSRLLVPALLLSLLAGYLAVMMVQGRFAVTDEMFFKAAGAQWAETGRFAAPEFSGFLGATPPVETIYAVYPPVYPFLFGIWVRLMGFSWQACVFYDAIIHVCLTLVVLLYAMQLDGRFKGFPGVLLVATILPLGTAGRPDELAMTFGTLGTCFLAVRGRGALGTILCGVAVGLAAGTSLGLRSLRPACGRKDFVRAANVATRSDIVCLVVCSLRDYHVRRLAARRFMRTVCVAPVSHAYASYSGADGRARGRALELCLEIRTFQRHFYSCNCGNRNCNSGCSEQDIDEARMVSALARPTSRARVCVDDSTEAIRLSVVRRTGIDRGVEHLLASIVDFASSCFGSCRRPVAWRDNR